VRLQNQLESLLEECHIKLSSLISDLFGVSARRMLKALADGETDPAALAALGDQRLRATPAQLVDALGACAELNAVYRRLLTLALEELQFIEHQMQQLDQEIASLLTQHQDAAKRLSEVPGLGVDSAQQIIAELGGPVWFLRDQPRATSHPAMQQASEPAGALGFFAATGPLEYGNQPQRFLLIDRDSKFSTESPKSVAPLANLRPGSLLR